MRKLINVIKSFPWYGWVFSFVLLGLEYGFYLLGGVVGKAIGLEPFCPKIPAIDNLFRFTPIFIIPYVIAYAYWVVGALVMSLDTKRVFINYVLANVLAYIIGFLIFIFFPTYISRTSEGVFDTLGNDFISWLCKFIYNNDGGEYGHNLLPSYHCILSTFCYLGVRKNKVFTLSFRIYTLVGCILICISTLFVKQHYFVDVILGVGIAIGCYYTVKFLNPGRDIARHFLL